MKKLFLVAAAMICLTVCTRAQTPQPKPEEPIWVKMTPSQLRDIQQVFSFSFQWLPKSAAPSMDVETAKTAMQSLFPILVADTTQKAKRPVIKK